MWSNRPNQRPQRSDGLTVGLEGALHSVGAAGKLGGRVMLGHRKMENNRMIMLILPPCGCPSWGWRQRLFPTFTVRGPPSSSPEKPTGPQTITPFYK